MNMSDLSIPDQYAYGCQMQRGNVKARAEVRETVIKRGAYTMNGSAYGIKRTRLGSKQEIIGRELLLEAKGNLTRALHAAGWHSERIMWGGAEVVLWWPPVAQ